MSIVSEASFSSATTYLLPRAYLLFKSIFFHNKLANNAASKKDRDAMLFGKLCFSYTRRRVAPLKNMPCSRQWCTQSNDERYSHRKKEKKNKRRKHIQT